jgi:LemA protein
VPLALATPLLVPLVLGGVVLLWAILVFNGLVRLRNKVREAFSGVDVQLVRRADLVPNLVRVVKAYAAHERETLEEVVEARSAAAAAEALPERAARENGLARSLDRLIALVERYPELKADASFRKLHGDLVEIEDDLQYARRYYNGTVRDLNTRTEQFPSNLVAAALRFRREPFFEVDSPAERHAPVLSFDT